MSRIRRRNMQWDERVGAISLPFQNTLLQCPLPINAEMAAVIPPGHIVAEINGLGKQPDRPIDPVADAEIRLGGPPLAQAVVKGRKREPQAFLVRKGELNILDHE